jgi:DNA (cytosine-5)-methyltransferase 1
MFLALLGSMGAAKARVSAEGRSGRQFVCRAVEIREATKSMKKSAKRVGASPSAKKKVAGSVRFRERKTASGLGATTGTASVVRARQVPVAAEARKAAAPLRFIDLFAGIGGIRLGFESAGCECVFSSEWDQDAAKTYEANFGDKPAGDITKIQNSSIPEHDILVGGFPCQAFSIIGDQKGFGDTRGTLFFEIERILRAKRPRAFLLENVRNLVSHDQGRTFKVINHRLTELGYHVHSRVLNALHYNLPQKRDRVIIVGFKDNHPFEWPARLPLVKTLASIIESDDVVDKKHFASDSVRLSVKERLVGKRLPPKPWICHENKSGNISPLPYSCALRAGASYNYLLVNGIRRLTPRENLRLQGFPDHFKTVVSDSAIRKQCGNSVPVTMISAVAAQVVAALARNPVALELGPKHRNAEQRQLPFPCVV